MMNRISFLGSGAVVGAFVLLAPRVARSQATTEPTVTRAADTALARDTVRRVAGYTGFTLQYSARARAGHATETSYPVINAVLPGSPAARAGVLPGDVVLEVNGKDARIRGAMLPVIGAPYVMRVRREDTEREIALTPIPKP